MRSTAFAAALAFLLWGAPTFAADFDGDGVEDEFDNCSNDSNDAQDDTDGDDCGNVCDADYNNDGIVGHPDVFELSAAFGTGDEEKCHQNGSIPGCFVGHASFGFILIAYGSIPGPSGTTTGTTACP